MVYWKDIPTDALYQSPFLSSSSTSKQYLTFEQDIGGFNNIRMALETVIGLAFAMGRTLVLPPENRMYLLTKSQGKQGAKQRDSFSFSHFFHMEAIHNEHVGIEIITMEEFLTREALTGKFRDKDGKVSYPPNKRTNWDGEAAAIFQWLRSVSRVTVWDPEDCLAAFPASSSRHDAESIKNMEQSITQQPPKFEDFVGKPVPIDAPPLERMREMWAARKGLCLYDEELQAAPFIHLPVDHKADARLLVHFYAFLFFQDWNEDLWMKRFMRDHVRYTDEIQCAAARIVQAVRRRARERDPKGNPEGLFDSMHIRRGDFQYKATRVSADKIYAQTKKVIAENSTVFVATDERDQSFFELLKQHYDLVFLDDFHEALGDLNTNYYGMTDQLVASRGRYFVGCWFSTFTVRRSLWDGAAS